MKRLPLVLVCAAFVMSSAWAASASSCSAPKQSIIDWMRFELSRCDAGAQALKDGQTDLALARWEHLSPSPDVPSRYFAVRKCLVGTGLVKDETELLSRLQKMSGGGAVRAPLMHATALLTKALNFKANRKPYQVNLAAAESQFKKDWSRGRADSGAVLALMQLDEVFKSRETLSGMNLLHAAAESGSSSAVASIAKFYRDGSYGSKTDCPLSELMAGIAGSMWNAEQR